MKYKCLILDHDDTVVNSTATIHYPCFIEYLEKYHPHLSKSYTLESYFLKNFHPGIVSFFRDEIGMSEEELGYEEEYWANFVVGHLPAAFAGIKEVLDEFVARGGVIVVDSHSMTRYIERDWAANALPSPSRIYGWDIPKEQRKPSPFTVLETLSAYSLDKSEVLVVDDLKPGYDMARAAGVDFAAAGWAYEVSEIESFMRKSCDYYLKTVKQFSKLVLED